VQKVQLKTVLLSRQTHIGWWEVIHTIVHLQKIFTQLNLWDQHKVIFSLSSSHITDINFASYKKCLIIMNWNKVIFTSCVDFDVFLGHFISSQWELISSSANWGRDFQNAFCNFFVENEKERNYVFKKHYRK